MSPGTKLYPKKSQTFFFLAMYAILAIAGGVLAGHAVMQNQSPGNAAGFMVVFGVGMLILTLVRSRKPQVVIFEDYLEVHQSRTTEYVRYRNIASVDLPDNKRLVITLREEGVKKDVTIWLKELDRAEVENLAEFLRQRRGKGR